MNLSSEGRRFGGLIAWSGKGSVERRVHALGLIGMPLIVLLCRLPGINDNCSRSIDAEAAAKEFVTLTSDEEKQPKR